MTQQEYIQLLQMSLQPVNRLSEGNLALTQAQAARQQQLRDAAEAERRATERIRLQEELMGRRQAAGDKAAYDRMMDAEELRYQKALELDSKRTAREDAKAKELADLKGRRGQWVLENRKEIADIHNQMEVALQISPESKRALIGQAAQMAGVKGDGLEAVRRLGWGGIKDATQLTTAQTFYNSQLDTLAAARQNDPVVRALGLRLQDARGFRDLLGDPDIDVGTLEAWKAKAEVGDGAGMPPPAAAALDPVEKYKRDMAEFRIFGGTEPRYPVPFILPEDAKRLEGDNAFAPSFVPAWLQAGSIDREILRPMIGAISPYDPMTWGRGGAPSSAAPSFDVAPSVSVPMHERPGVKELNRQLYNFSTLFTGNPYRKP